MGINPDVRGFPDDKEEREELYRTLRRLQRMIETEQATIESSLVREGKVVEDGEDEVTLSVEVDVRAPEKWQQYRNLNAPDPE